MMETLNVQVPQDISNMSLPHPGLLNFYKDSENRVFWLDGDIDYSTLEFVKVIMRCNKEDESIPVEDRKPIKLFIDTPGGDVQVMWSLIKAMKISKTPIYTIAFCNAMSAGAHILAAGHRRLAMPGSTVLVHSGSCRYDGDLEKVESSKKYYDALSKRANDMLLENTKISPKDLKRKGANDWYITAENAVELGIVDAIVNDFSEVM